jgi:antitoxin PrlF
MRIKKGFSWLFAATELLNVDGNFVGGRIKCGSLGKKPEALSKIKFYRYPFPIIINENKQKDSGIPVGTLTDSEQITLQKKIREQLQLQPADRMDFLVEPDLRITVWTATSDLTILKDLIPQPKQPIALETMRTAINQRGSRPRGVSIRLCESPISS